MVTKAIKVSVMTIHLTGTVKSGEGQLKIQVIRRLWRTRRDRRDMLQLNV